jgi:spermidine synthase
MLMTYRWLFVACYCASGAAALMYQVVWVRLLTLALGHTVASSSIVLGAFMCGLALGAWVAGRFKLPPSQSLALYAALELFIAIAALTFPTVLSLFDPLLVWAYADGNSPVRFSLIRTLVCFVLVGVPAAAMGATFPVAVSWFVSVGSGGHSPLPSPAATRAGVLYAANTAGAALGALAAGFWLVPSYGARATTWIAVALNVLAAGGAVGLLRSGGFFVDGRAETPPAPLSPPRAARPAQRGSRRKVAPTPQRAVAATAAAISGFSALVFEVAWTRLIALVIGPTTYAFALMAASFIVGIAIGSAVGVRLTRRTTQPAMWLSAMLIATAAGTLLAAWFAATEIPTIVARSVLTVSGFGALLWREALVVGLVLTAASVAFGTTFTVALATASADASSAARDTSNVYTANTIGAVVGSLAAGFVLIPGFGLASTFVHTSRLLIVAAGLLAAITLFGQRTRRAGARLVMGAAVVLLAVTFVLPPWNQALLASGLYKYARQMHPDDLETNFRAGHLEYYKEGAAGTVSVKLLGGTRSLAIDGKVDASNGSDMLTQRLLGLLPALVHPRPQEALVIGLGTGVTADAVRASGAVQRLDILEISPEVVEAAALFERENRRILQAPGVRLLVGDGRTHLQLTPRRYDVIVSEPSNPWMAGVAALFTREFFEAVRRRLSADGVFCQWAHTYEIEAGDLQSIVRTFASVFPHGTLWLVGDGDLLLIGSNSDDLERQLAGIAERAQRDSIATLIEETGVARASVPFFVLSMYAGGPQELASYGASARLQSDDVMDLEFTAARAMYAPPDGNAPTLRALAERAARPAAIAASVGAARAGDWIARGNAALRAEAFGMAHDSFRRAAALESGNVEALRGGAMAAAAAGLVAEETKWLRERAGHEPQNAAARTALSHVLAIAGDMQGAVAAAAEAVDLAPDRPEPLEQLASVLADTGDVRLASVTETLVGQFPAREEGRFYQATSLVMRNRHEEAERVLDALIAANPRHAKARNLRGIICATRGDLGCAIAEFEASLKADPRDSSVYVNLGHAHLERGDAATAERLFSEAVALDPSADSARDGLRAIARN